MKNKPNIAIIGITGLVGKEFLKIIEQRHFPYNKIFLFASQKHIGVRISVNNELHIIRYFDEKLFNSIDIAFFSAGSSFDRENVPKAASRGTICIDNSSAFRKEKDIPLVVPELNFHKITYNDKIIANPNCSTIQLVYVLDALKSFDIEHIYVNTYQSISGAGKKALELYYQQSQGAITVNETQYYDNIIQYIGNINEYGYCEEEEKIMFETKKILDNNELKISATCMRVPVSITHMEVITIRFRSNVKKENIVFALKKKNDIIELKDNVNIKDVKGSDKVFVSRIREDINDKNTIHFIITADNLRIGAALNAIKIAERILYENN